MLSHVHYLLWLNGREPSHIVSCALLHTFNGRPGRSTRRYHKKSLLSDGDAHGTGGTGDDLLGGVNVVGIEVRHLDLGDLGELLLGELTNLVGLGLSGTRLEVQLLLDEVSRRRVLVMKEKDLSS